MAGRQAKKAAGPAGDYLRLADAARELGVSKSRVEQYVREGRLAVAWVLGLRVVGRPELAAFRRRAAGRPRKAV